MLIKFIQDEGSKYLTLIWNTLYVYISTSVVLLPPMTLPVALYGKICRLIGHCPLIDIDIVILLIYFNFNRRI